MNTQSNQNQNRVIEVTSTQVIPRNDRPTVESLLPEPIQLDGIDAENPKQIDNLRRKLHFVRRRSEGATYAVIAAELGVSPSTLVNWSREYRQDIQNLRAMRMEALQNEILNDPELRVRRMARLLSEIETELSNRKISELPTSRLFSMADTLRRRITQETGSLKFAASQDELLANEDVREFVWKG